MPGIARPDFKDRRDFIKSAGLAATGFAALPLLGCGTQSRMSLDQGGESNPLAIPRLQAGTIERGERVFRLSLTPGEKEFAPGTASPTIGIDASYLGPTLEMRRGEQARFHIDNKLAEDATVHWHGFELPATADGGPHQLIRPGARWSPSFEIRQRASLYW